MSHNGKEIQIMGKMIDYETEISHRKGIVINIVKTDEEQRKDSLNRLDQYFKQQKKLEEKRG